MASTADFVSYVVDQVRSAGAVRTRKMFGEYMIYVNEKPLILVCDNTAYVKKLDCVSELLANADTGTPYTGAKEHYILDVDNAAMCLAVLAALEPVTPLPKPRTPTTKSLVARAAASVHAREYSCAVIRNARIFRSAQGSGIGPLVALYDEGCLKNAVVVDRIVGRAAAMILVLGEAKSVYALTASLGAQDYLKAHAIKAEIECVTDAIVNRQGDGVCPMERAVADIDDPYEGLAAIRETIARITQNGGI